MRRWNYRDPLTTSDIAVWGYVLALPVGLVVGGLATTVTGTGLRQVVGVLTLVLGGVVSWWAWWYLRRPARPASDEDFDREIRYRLDDERRKQSSQ